MCVYLWSGPPGFNRLISFYSSMQLYVLYVLWSIFVLSPFITQFVCTRWYIDKLGIFHAYQTSICLDPHQKWRWGWHRQTCFSLPVIFLLTVPRPWFHYGSLLFVFRVCLLYCLVCSLQPCGHLLGKGWPLGSLVCDIFLCFVTFTYLVS